MSDDFPKEFDLIVVGTGVTESIIAAAASRIGKTVLHLDQNDYYGGLWASFNLESLQNHAKQEITPSTEPLFTSDGLEIHSTRSKIENVEINWKVDESSSSENSTAEEEARNVKEELLKKNRHFNLDLWPTLLYSLGGMVKLLISSNICRYAEFRAIDRVATLLNGEVKTVPCSRSDVFVTNEVTVVEKRIMMKLIETCMELKEGSEEFDSFRNKTFQEFLVAKRAPPKVQHYLMNALSMSTAKTSFEKGLYQLSRFVESLGRYGNSPFLFPMYGCGEIPQCFCRLCAVFGGIYCLQKGLKSMKRMEDKKLNVQLESGEEITVNNVVFGPKAIRTNEKAEKEQPERHLARAILIVDQPLKDTNEKPKGGGVEFLRLTNDSSEAFLFQLSHYSGCCPKDFFVYHFTCETEGDTLPKAALQPFMEQIFSSQKEEGEEKESKSPQILFEMFFTIPVVKNRFQLSEGIHIAGGPSMALDYDNYIDEAREIFLKLYPEEEFLPRAPEPEEIIMDGYDDKAAQEEADQEKGTEISQENKVVTEKGEENYEETETKPEETQETLEATAISSD